MLHYAAGEHGGRDRREVDTDIVYAAEKRSIADVLSTHLHCRVAEDELEVRESPTETGSFLVRWRRGRFVLAPERQVYRRSPRVCVVPASR